MFKGYILQYHDVSHDIRVITIQLPKDKPYSYQAGQYAVMHVDGEDPRPFSIASAPRPDNTIDIHVRDSGQNLSHCLCETLTQGQAIWVSDPKGNMTIRPDDKSAVFLAGGTGITPFLAILDTVQGLNPITLYWGMNSEHDFYVRPHGRGLTVHYCTDTYPIDACLKNIEDDATYYLSGPPSMVKDSLSKLLSVGIERSRIIFDE